MKAVVLAAGKGSRLNSASTNIPKVLRTLHNKELVKYVLANIDDISPSDTTLVVGFEAQKVVDCVGKDYNYAVQSEQLGTGHAVMCAKEYFENAHTDVLVTLGDMPLISRESYRKVIAHHKASKAACTILTVVMENPPSYGRILRENGKLVGIIEQKDCTEEQRAITELNTGVAVYDTDLLAKYLSQLGSNNSQNEYYLTDIPKILIENGYAVEGISCENEYESFGVTSEEDIAICEEMITKLNK